MRPRRIDAVRGGYIKAKDGDSIRKYFVNQGWEIAGKFAVNPETGRRWLFVDNKAFSHWKGCRNE